METTIHYPKTAEPLFREFERKRVEFLMQEISGWSADDLTALKSILGDEN